MGLIIETRRGRAIAVKVLSELEMALGSDSSRTNTR